MVWRNMNMTREVYREILVDKLLPAIVEKWPKLEFELASFKIAIQQDGA